MSASLPQHFSSLEDPRIERNQRHALLDILLLTVCAVVSGADGSAAALAALEDLDFIRETVAANKAERASFEALLTELGIFYYPSATNFIFLKVPNANALADDLMHAGYLVRRGLAPDCLRLTVGQAEDNKIIKDIITRFAKV